MDLDTLTSLLTQRGRALERRAAIRDGLVVTIVGLTGEIERLTAETALLTQAGAVLSSIADERQEAVRHQIEVIVTRGLEQVFGPGLSFHLAQATRGSATVIDFLVRSTFADGSTLDTSVMDARGGGLAEVTGFLLRVVVLLLTPGHRRLLVLDESFAMVSAEYLTPLAEFVAELARVAGVQILMVTHQDEFAAHADTSYRFSLDSDGKTKVAAG